MSSTKRFKEISQRRFLYSVKIYIKDKNEMQKFHRNTKVRIRQYVLLLPQLPVPIV